MANLQDAPPCSGGTLWWPGTPDGSPLQVFASHPNDLECRLIGLHFPKKTDHASDVAVECSPNPQSSFFLRTTYILPGGEDAFPIAMSKPEEGH